MKILNLTIVLSLLLITPWLQAAEFSAKARSNFEVIDALDVEHHWPAGVHVNWESGVPDGHPERHAGKHTHCSAFVAAAAKKLDIYILRPPEHGQMLLANAQSDWFATEKAKSLGWSLLKSQTLAQRAANDGEFVVAVYKNHKASKPGHIAIVRPSLKSESEINKEGPDITQAGMKNYLRTTVKSGFAGHPKAFAGDEIKYYQHPVP